MNENTLNLSQIDKSRRFHVRTCQNGKMDNPMETKENDLEDSNK